MKRIFPYLVAIAALTLAGTSAYYSIYGLSKFYAGAANAVIIMGIAIEASKIIATSILHQYHKVLNWSIKIYLTLAIILSMIITSAGIYGFLTNAYQQTATKVELLDGEVGIIENKKTYFQNNIDRTQSLINNKNARINTLSTVRSQQESRLQSLYDSKSTAAAKRTESQIKNADMQIEELGTAIDALNLNITSLNDSIAVLDNNILLKNNNSDVAGEVGPLRFISKLINVPMNSVVNWFTILLIMIFDPLAIALIIVFNRITNLAANNLQNTLPPNEPDEPLMTNSKTNEPVLKIIKLDDKLETSEDIYNEHQIKKKSKNPGKPVYW